MKFLTTILFIFFCRTWSFSSDSITVYLFLLDECRICQELAPEINAIHKAYGQSNIGFLGLFPNFASKPAGIEKFKKKYNITLPTKTDYYKKMAKKFNAEILPTVVIYNETTQNIEYIGAINDLFYKPGKRKAKATKHFLRDALNAILIGKAPEIKLTQAIGCFINFNDNLFNQ
jgi:thiol-disulfide isomerase/thioredoxin